MHSFIFLIPSGAVVICCAVFDVLKFDGVGDVFLALREKGHGFTILRIFS